MAEPDVDHTDHEGFVGTADDLDLDTPHRTPDQVDLRRRIRQATPRETWEPLTYDEHIEWAAHMEELGDEISDLRGLLRWAEHELARRETLAKAAASLAELEASVRRLSSATPRPTSTHFEWKMEKPDLRLVEEADRG